jgi:hypothetical protein
VRVVIPITALGNCIPYVALIEERTMTNNGTYEGWWDRSLIDPRNERALLSAFVAAIAAWSVIFLLVL